MKKISIIWIAIVCITLAGTGAIQAQDPHFSQYFASPMTLNPALTGAGVSDWRASAVYRAQWWGSYIEPYTTTAVSVEKTVLANAESKSSLAFGLSMLNDASNGGLLKNNFFSFAGAYHVALDGEGSAVLSGGIMATYANRLLDPGKFQFQEQYGSMGFQRSAPSGDPVNIMSNKYWDVHAGLQFSKNTATFGYDLGAAVYHAGRPSEGAYNNHSYSLDPRISFQAGVHFIYTNNNQLNTRFITDIQGSNRIFTLGGQYGIGVNDETIRRFDIGLWHRFGDATCPYAGVAGKNWQAGVSYDFVISDIKTVNNSVQSLELSVVWQFGSKRFLKGENQRIAFY
jgi:type IX secretion system PorP/SprF family membrane protein